MMDISQQHKTSVRGSIRTLDNTYPNKQAKKKKARNSLMKRMCYVVYLCRMLVKCSNGSAEVVNRRLHKWTIIKNHEKHPSVYSDLPRKGTTIVQLLKEGLLTTFYGN